MRALLTVRMQSAPGPTQHRYAPYQPVRPASAPIGGIAHRVQRSVQPQINEAETLLQRAERIISSVPTNNGQHDHIACAVCRKQALEDELLAAKLDRSPQQAEQRSPNTRSEMDGFLRPQPTRPAPRAREPLPMQTVISRTLRELEDDFEVHKR